MNSLSLSHWQAWGGDGGGKYSLVKAVKQGEGRYLISINREVREGFTENSHLSGDLKEASKLASGVPSGGSSKREKL